MRRIAIGVVLAALIGRGAGAADSVPADVAGWDKARWGMTAAELEPLFGSVLQRLPARREYGGSYADRAVAKAALGPVRFTALLQMDERSDRLRQVLLERQGALATPRAFQGAVQALRQRYGAPSHTCTALLGSKEATVTAASWRFPTTTIHAAYTDFYTSAILHSDPHQDPNPLVPYVETRRNNPRFLPRRVTVRFHASDDLALGAEDACTAPKSR